jgi:exosortase D (VPLPA-CTERM-specific)
MTIDTADNKKLLNLSLPVAALAFFIVGYWPFFQKLVSLWDSGDNNYGYLIVPLFFYLCWEKKDSFRFADFSWNPWGLVPVILSILVAVIGELGSVETLIFIGIWGGVAGILAVLYGGRVRFLILPLLILVFIVPLPPFVNNLLTFKLKMLASSLSVQMLQLSGISVFQDGNIIDLGVEKLQVVDACSGLRYIMPMFLMALLIGHFFSPGLWRTIVLLLMVFPLSIFINSLRIYITGLLTVSGHQELAENFFHDLAGLVIFLIAGAGLVTVARLIREKNPNKRIWQAIDPGGRQVSLITSLSLTVVVSLLFIGSGWALQKLPSAQIIPDRTTFENFPMKIAGWQGERQYLSQEILDSLWSDDYVDAIFTRPDLPNQIYLLIPYYEYQGTRHTVHAPQSCLLGGGWALTSSKERRVMVGGGREIPVMTMTLEKGNHKMLGSYFFLQRGRVITSPWMNKAYLMWDAFTKRRTDGALVRVEMVVAPGQSMDFAYGELEKFITELWGILPVYVPD